MVVIDLLEALNVTRSVRGVSRAAGPEPGVPAWKFRQRVPHLTLPWDYAVYLLASSQGALGFHFVARQSRGSAGTLISLVSPAAAARDGRPLLQLASSARANQLRLDYRAGPGMEPASLLFPGGSPLARGRWARLALDLQPHRLALFVDCHPAVLLEGGGPGDALSLLLPLDLQVTFASLPGDAASKFLGYWQTAEISPSGFPRRPWHCENLADPFPVPHTLVEEGDLAEPPFDQGSPLAPEPPALADIRNYQQQPGEPEFPPGVAQPQPGALEERVQQLEELVDGFGAALDEVKAQNSELLARVKSLESCECRRPVCVWAGTQREDGASWDKDDCTTCVCLQGAARCSARQDRPQCLGCEYDGQRYQDGDAFLATSNPCMNCSCLEGNVQCFRLVCPQLHCATQEEVPGACCPRCQGCVDGAARREHGEEWAPRADPCQSCRCLEGRAVCRKRQCARLCRHPASPRPGTCCPVCDGCSLDGREFASGEPVPSGEPCTQCACVSGNVLCKPTGCPAAPCPEPVRRPGECCPRCQDCLSGTQPVPDGAVFTPPQEPCLRCRCQAGEVSCERLEQSCPPAPCSHPGTAPGQCCPACHTCEYEGRPYRHGETFTPPGHGPCARCTCSAGHVRCQEEGCPPVPCAQPIRDPQRCCPICKVCVVAGEEFEEGAQWEPDGDPCTTCTCLAREPVCGALPCPPVACQHPARRSGDCCPTCAQCAYHQHVYANGQPFADPHSPCQRCQCTDGTVQCSPVACPPPSCPRPERQPGQCCPTCPGCSMEGVTVAAGERFPSPRDPCQLCVCTAGDVSCSARDCPGALCARPLPGSCCQNNCNGCMYDGEEHANGTSWFSSPCVSCLCIHGIATCAQIRCLGSCLRPVQVPGECCPLCADCMFEGRPYSPGESFQPSLDPCEICTCELLAAGGPHVRCYRRQCPSLVGCPRSQLQPPGPHHCCPTCAQALSNCTAELAGNELQAADDPCSTCQCKDLTWVCVRQGCPQLSCPLTEQFTAQGACCPVCDECVIETGGRRVSDGESWTDSEDDCISCTCNRGHVECHIAECEPVECQGGLRRVRMPGSCCYECQDPDGCCSYQGQRYQASEHWQVDTCTTCTCVSGEVHCRSQRCPTAACAADETPALTPGMCCPHCLPRPATCLAFGDPHYRTFDGRLLHFQGTCTYVLAQDCRGGDFSIHVTNDDRGRPGVAWTKEVTVQVGDAVVQLLQDWLVRVDGQVVTLPFLKEPHLYVERQTNTVLLNTNIGVKVLWSGRSQLEVSVPGTYKGHTCGLCGDFNGHPQDDARLRSGQLARAEAAFGNSWRVPSGNGTGGPCADGRDVDPCKEAGYRARKEANARCKVLKSGAFEPCHPLVPPEPFFAACVYDLCACGAGADQCLCDALEAYAALCRRAGLALRWRSPTLCAVGCPQDRGYVFDECGPPCPKTCYNKDAPLGAIESRCFTPCVPGCQCPAGRVEHEAHCILPEACPRVVYGSL
ncbi:hypothetical protein KIL84_020190 [Mauremys mutica]|uniref:Kielin/chordin-like protein n=1 Tax=Mauremys mutica TaxID=74926 RepID=A0A9D4BAZ5_9SAUR|nr:hypothetical protein KIL84_020190 [Mauremys mutica]